MRQHTRRIALVAVGTTVASLALLAPASAGTTDVTFELTAGSLSISQQPAASLGSVGTGALQLGGPLGDVEVTDERGAVLGYTAQVVGTDFVKEDGSYTIESTNAVYDTGDVTGTGTATRAAGATGPLDPTVPHVALTATLVTGNNTSAWNPTVTVTLPSDALAGTYNGTITHSVA
jgi:hypothetical protein